MDKPYELLIQEAAEHLQIAQFRLEAARAKATTQKQRTHLIEIGTLLLSAATSLSLLRALSRNQHH